MNTVIIIVCAALIGLATKLMELFYQLVAGVTGLEPAASGVTVRYLRVIRGNMVTFVLNTAHRLPPIPTQKLEQTGTISCNVPACFSFSSSCLLILTSQSPFHRFCRAVQP